MTIIKNTLALINYPFLMLSPDVVVLFQRCGKGDVAALDTALKVFECYCHLTNSPVFMSSLASKAFAKTVQGFLIALAGEDLVATRLQTRRRYARIFLRAIEKMAIKSPWLAAISYESWITDTGATANNKSSSMLDFPHARYWNGWEIITNKGVPHFLALPCVWHSHGQAFTEEFYENLRLFYEKQARPGISEINKLAKFLSENATTWPPETFKNPIMIKKFFLSFMKDFFMSAYDKKLNLNSQIKAWGRMISNLEETFLQSNVWALPFDDSLPKPTERKVSGTPSRVSLNKEGIEVHEKLITSVPLHLTDTEAIEILFHDIEADLHTVKKWAHDQCEKIYSSTQRRLDLSKQGTPNTSGAWGVTTEKLNLNNLCATFERDGFSNDSYYINARYSAKISKGHLAELLGLPTHGKLFPFQCLLVIEHPEITHGFLKKLILHDKNGDMVGFKKTATEGNWLIGYKDRRGSKLSEQKVKLNPSTTELIEKIIKITKPLRDFLKERNDDTWRELFITCGFGFSTPSSAEYPSWNKSAFKGHPKYLDMLKDQFHGHTTRRDGELEAFLARVSISTLRASSGVLVYLKTKSVAEMAKALGHARYDTLLMKRYLPEAILAFFQTRWIRIFQKGFICEAMKDSPYLLEAANFASMEDLHSFLTNHALKCVPQHLSNPEHTMTGKEISADHNIKQVLISIDPGIMTALVSLEKAVDTASTPEKICGRATYWADLSRKVVAEINRGNDYLLKQHLSDALSHCNPEKMKGLIYETSSRA
ncbi:hypothetical protein [Stutzerimonas stutzeri]|uniref:hypothetical protein n=1 Tax=Stutzerimonas stutzeri TaxID=316 RepID=UPI001C478396|nr:hypothetical protein [Stutzerimonas stutzeri]